MAMENKEMTYIMKSLTFKNWNLLDYKRDVNQDENIITENILASVTDINNINRLVKIEIKSLGYWSDFEVWTKKENETEFNFLWSHSINTR